jgi:hypothetical protein
VADVALDAQERQRTAPAQHGAVLGLAQAALDDEAVHVAPLQPGGLLQRLVAGPVQVQLDGALAQQELLTPLWRQRRLVYRCPAGEVQRLWHARRGVNAAGSDPLALGHADLLRQHTKDQT